METRGPDASVADRRKFLGTSFGAVPLIMTTGSSWGGGDGKKSLWASGGKKKDDFGFGSPGGGGKKSGTVYEGKNWSDWDEPPQSAGSVKFSDGDTSYSGTAKSSDWDWNSPREDWRKWRPEVEESQSPRWEWNRNDRDVPATHIEKTIRPKD